MTDREIHHQNYQQKHQFHQHQQQQEQLVQSTSKNDKKHRKLIKSPQVSCDISMVSSSASPSSYQSYSSNPVNPVIPTSTKYIAYPSSLPSNYTDECLIKNFEYLRTDITNDSHLISANSNNTTNEKQSLHQQASPPPPPPQQQNHNQSTNEIPFMQRKSSFSLKSFENFRNQISNLTSLTTSQSSSNHRIRKQQKIQQIDTLPPTLPPPQQHQHQQQTPPLPSSLSLTQQSISISLSTSAAAVVTTTLTTSTLSQVTNNIDNNFIINSLSQSVAYTTTNTLINRIPTCCLKNQQDQQQYSLKDSATSTIIQQKPMPPSSTIKSLISPTTTFFLNYNSNSISTNNNNNISNINVINNSNVKEYKNEQQSKSSSPAAPAVSTIKDKRPISQAINNQNYNNNIKENLCNENNNQNLFSFGNFFKISDNKLTSTTTGIPSTSPVTSSIITTTITTTAITTKPKLASSTSTSITSNNPFLSENNKRDEFLKATMKICLVVSPPSNKLLQLKSKSLTHLDTLDESHNSAETVTECLSPKSKGACLEVQNRRNKMCCLSSSSSTSQPMTISSTIKKKSSSFTHRKKPTLTRSEVSSSEYFSVYFDVESALNKEKEDLIPAIKGVHLIDALNSSLLRRNLSFSQIKILDNNFQSSLDLGTPPYSGGFDRNTDVGNLVGKSLIVTDKENSNHNRKPGHHYSLQKAASFGSRTRPAKLFQSASTEESTEHSNDPKTLQAGSKQPKQRWSVLFGLKNPHQNQLCEILNHYARYGVPQICSTYSFENLQALDYLENIHGSWTDFVYYNNMTDNEVKIQSTIWELVTTEIDYIHTLKTVTDLFLACLEAIQLENILIDIDQNKLFSNIRDICKANIKFWTMYLFPMVNHSITTGHPMCIDYFQQGFVTFATTFSPYKKYCAEQSTCQFYCKELNRTNSLFTAYLAWCESQKLCNRLRLADILVRPMQRLTKYSLLLIAIRKYIVDENDGEIMDAMIHSVENFVCSVNSHLTARQENERLKGIMARIESYDVVDSNNEHLDKMAKQYSSMFDLCGPMKGCANTQGRHLFMEGDLKYKDNINKVDVHCFLLTDILLVCKTIAKKGLGTLKVIRQPFLTDRLVVKVKENTLYSVYLNEFNVAINAFTLQCPEAKSWHDAISKAKHIYSRLKQGCSSWDGYNIKYTNSNSINNNNETLGIRKSPLNSSIGSKVSSLNNSHSGSVELNESRNVSIDFDKTNSLSSDEGQSSVHGVPMMKKVPQNSPTKFKGSNSLIVQPLLNLGQSLPNLTVNSPHLNTNTLLVPGAVSTSSGHSNLLSPSHRGISYPPPSPTRATLRRGFAFSASIKNPPLVKTRNIISQNSVTLPLQQATSTAIQPTTSQQQQPQYFQQNSFQQINESDV